MKSPHDDNDSLDVPSEIAEAFRAPAPGLAPQAGTFDALRRRAVARRRRRALGVAAAVAVCLAGTSAVVAMTRPGDDETTTASPPSVTDSTSADPGADPNPTGEESPDLSPPPPTTASPRESETGSGTGAETSTGTETDTPPTTGTPELPICESAQLDLTLGRAEGAAGSLYLPLEFTNTGEESCGMTGWPGVSLVAREEGEPIGSPAERDEEQGPATRVELAPGATVIADLRVARAENYPAEDCEPVPAGGLLVYPPDELDSVFVPYEGLTGCAVTDVNLLGVTVVHLE
jgi:uncharacterized protein DUF4232